MPRDPINPDTGRSVLDEEVERSQTAKGPAETAISPSHGSHPSTKKDLNAMSNTSTPAPAASLSSTLDEIENLVFKVQRRTMGLEWAVSRLIDRKMDEDGDRKVPDGMAETIAHMTWEAADAAKALDAAFKEYQERAA